MFAIIAIMIAVIVIGTAGFPVSWLGMSLEPVAVVLA